MWSYIKYIQYVRSRTEHFTAACAPCDGRRESVKEGLCEQLVVTFSHLRTNILPASMLLLLLMQHKTRNEKPPLFSSQRRVCLFGIECCMLAAVAVTQCGV